MPGSASWQRSGTPAQTGGDQTRVNDQGNHNRPGQTPATPPKTGQVVAAVALAVTLGVAFAAWPYLRPLPPSTLQTPPAPVVTAPDATSAPDVTTDAAAAPVAPSPTAAEVAAVVADAGDQTVLRVVADPPELRVWANTRVRLSVETAESFSRFVWHFEDGSEPVSGAVVEHVFAESVRDRHVTVEGLRPGQPPLVATRRLPVERLAVLTASGDEPADEARLPAADGTRLLLVGGTLDPVLAMRLTDLAATSGVTAIVAMGDATAADQLAHALDVADPGVRHVALLHAPVALDPAQPADAPLKIVRNPGEVVTNVRKGTRDLGVLAVEDLALVAIDTRGQTVAEVELKRMHDALQWTGAFRATVVLSARPWTQTRDRDLIADRSYRLYEYALRQQVSAVVWASSGVFLDGRFGGLHVVGVGQANPATCVHPLGEDTCQPPSLTLLDVPPGRPLVARVLTGDDFAHVLARHALPAEVGKIRR